MRLVCASDFANCPGFKTSLGDLFALLPFRKNRMGLKKLLAENPEYREMDEETAQTISVLMGIDFMGKKEKYREEGGYNMCQAIQEMVEEGRMEGLIQVAERMLRAGKYTDEEIVSCSSLPMEQIRELKERL